MISAALVCRQDFNLSSLAPPSKILPSYDQPSNTMVFCHCYPLRSFASSYFSHSRCHITLALSAVLCCSQLFSAASCPPHPPPPGRLVVPRLAHSHTAASPSPFAVPPRSLLLHLALLFTSSCWEQPMDPSPMTINGVGRLSQRAKTSGGCGQKSDAQEALRGRSGQPTTSTPLSELAVSACSSRSGCSQACELQRVVPTLAPPAVELRSFHRSHIFR